MKAFINVKVNQMYIPNEGWFGDKDSALVNVSQITSIYHSKTCCNIRVKDGVIYKLSPKITLDDLYKEIMEL